MWAPRPADNWFAFSVEPGRRPGGLTRLLGLNEVGRFPMVQGGSCGRPRLFVE